MPAFTVNMLPIIVLLSGPYLMLAIMLLVLRKRNKTLALPIERASLQRLPGFGISEQLLGLQLELMASLFIVSLFTAMPFSFVGFEYFIVKGHFPWFVIIVVLGGLCLCSVQTWRVMHKITRLRLGHTAELATASELIGLQALGYQVFHDIQAENFNIDHIIVGPNGVFAIETKGRHKRLKDHAKRSNYHLVYEATGKSIDKNRKDQQPKLIFPSWSETKPLAQAQRQAKWVSDWLTQSAGLTVTALPVLVFPGWFIELKAKPPFPILSHKQLLFTLSKLNHQMLTPTQINSIAHQIAQRCICGKPQ